jgi:hypothetical protein
MGAFVENFVSNFVDRKHSQKLFDEGDDRGNACPTLLLRPARLSAAACPDLPPWRPKNFPQAEFR